MAHATMNCVALPAKPSGFLRGVPMLYMIVERFSDGDAVPVYRRFRDHGRFAPEGLRYVDSWVTDDFRRCFQIMECGDAVSAGSHRDRAETLIW